MSKDAKGHSLEFPTGEEMAQLITLAPLLPSEGSTFVFVWTTASGLTQGLITRQGWLPSLKIREAKYHVHIPLLNGQ